MSDEVAAPVEQKAPETSEAGAPAADVKAGDAPAPAAADGEKPATTATEGKMTTLLTLKHNIVCLLREANNYIFSAEPKDTEDKKPAADADVDMKDAPEAAEKASEPAGKAEETKSEAQPETTKPAEEEQAAASSEEKPATEEKPVETAEEESGAVPAADSTPVNKNRRKSAVASTGKKLNKKASRAKILHLDAQPGDHFFARLKGFPPWPVIVCDEEMLPQNMINSRPVTAVRPDGTYRDDYADGGKKAADRTYPVMYLQTNEL